MDGTALPSLPNLALCMDRAKVDPDKITTEWLNKLQACFTDKDFSGFSGLFIDNCWWRDILALEWDFTSKQGHDAIKKYVSSSDTSLFDLKQSTGGLKPLLIELGGQMWIQSGFTFTTRHGHGRGFLRLTNVTGTEWKAWTAFTQLEELNFQKELDGRRLLSQAAAARMSKVNDINGANGVNGFKNDEPSVLIIGAGQAGVSLGARLRHMGIPALLVDRHARVGDSWRKRYKSVMLNTPTFTDHYPFLRYPENWPRWLSRDPVADFLEHYTQIMGLDVQTSTKVTSIERDAQGGYRVQLQGPYGARTLTPQHVVLATGVYSDEAVVPEFSGQELFKGQMYHSSQHTSAESVPDIQTKKVIVIGCSTSGHDVAQDFVNHGAKDVTMIQRHAIFSLSTDAWETLQLGIWNMEGITTEEADLVGNSIPLAVARSMSIGLTRAMAAFDKDMVEGLKKAGLALRTGEDGYGLADHQLIKGGHYYIDQGANQMIIDGRIKIRRCEEGVESFSEHSLALADGTHLEADIVVLATGYKQNFHTVKRLLGEEGAKGLVEGFGDLDSEQERAGWWRPTGIPGLWFMTGSFMWCRQFSQALALQIAAAVKGYR